MVVESLMIARGMSGSLIVLTMVFVFALAWPAFLCIAAAMGISDVWLDYRRLESPGEVRVVSRSTSVKSRSATALAVQN